MNHYDTFTLSRYLDGDLPLPARRGVEQHVERCLACRRELDVLCRVDQLVGSWASEQQLIPVRTELRILSSVDRRRRLRPLISLSRMLPAAVGSSIAALLVVMSANGGWLYQTGARQGPPTAAPSVARIVAAQVPPRVHYRRFTTLMASAETAVQPARPTTREIIQNKYRHMLQFE